MEAEDDRVRMNTASDRSIFFIVENQAYPVGVAMNFIKC